MIWMTIAALSGAAPEARSDSAARPALLVPSLGAGVALARLTPPQTTRGDTVLALAGLDSTLQQGRPRAVRHSDSYYTRATIHRAASYLTLPLFAAEYFAGEQILSNGSRAPSWARTAHGPVALGLETLFAVNTVTGVWNWLDSRKESQGRARRTIHGLLMMVANAGFVYTAAIAPSDYQIEQRVDRGIRGGWTPHKRAAVASMGVATASYLMMLIWKD